MSESLGKVRAAEERLDQEKDDLRDQIRTVEKQRADLEAKLAHSLRQEIDMREALEKVGFVMYLNFPTAVFVDF